MSFQTTAEKNTCHKYAMYAAEAGVACFCHGRGMWEQRDALIKRLSQKMKKYCCVATHSSYEVSHQQAKQWNHGVAWSEPLQ